MEQEEYFGFGSIMNLKEILKNNNVKKIFLVTGKDSYKSCGAEKAISQLISKYTFLKFCDFEENPKIEDVKKGINLFREFNPDLVIGAGGGTVLDMAKLLNILSPQTNNPEEYIYGSEDIKESGKTLILIPTTSGTGSEATHFAVVYIGKNKYSLANKNMLPDYSIVDLNFTLNLPKKITASTGIDALSQAIESYWNVDSTEESKDYSRKAINLIMENLKIAVNNPTDESRLAMAKAAHLAGKAINITKTTAPHAISYSFTSYFGIPHGHATGLTLGEIFLYNSLVTEEDVIDKRGVSHIQRIINELNTFLGTSDANSSREKIKNLMNSIGLETNLSLLGVKKEDIGLILDSVNIERLKNNPRFLTRSIMKYNKKIAKISKLKKISNAGRIIVKVYCSGGHIAGFHLLIFKTSFNLRNIKFIFNTPIVFSAGRPENTGFRNLDPLFFSFQ